MGMEMFGSEVAKSFGGDSAISQQRARARVTFFSCNIWYLSNVLRVLLPLSREKKKPMADLAPNLARARHLGGSVPALPKKSLFIGKPSN